MTTYILSGEARREQIAINMTTYELIRLIVNAVVEVGILALLIPMRRLFKRALKLQKLTTFFKENAIPRNTVLLFTIFYVLRTIVVISHGVLAIFLYYKWNHNELTI